MKRALDGGKSNEDGATRGDATTSLRDLTTRGWRSKRTMRMTR